MPSQTISSSAIILAGNGTNCERETAHACTLAGFDTVDIITVWELLEGKTSLDDFDFLVLPGGFLDGDDLGSARAQANRILHTRVSQTDEPLIEQFSRFILWKKPILGICNGFQLMVKLGMLPALEERSLTQEATLTHNDSGRFEDRWVMLRVHPNTRCIYTQGIDTCYLPVRHGEGKFIVRDQTVLSSMKQNGQVVVHYIDPVSGLPTADYPANPNGSIDAIAGICNPTGLLFGLMPHPEACIDFTHHPRWTRDEGTNPGQGLVFFQNARQYSVEKKLTASDETVQ